MISPTMSPHRRSVVIVVVAVFLVVVLTATSVQNNLANGRIVAARPPLRIPILYSGPAYVSLKVPPPVGDPDPS